MHITSHIEQQKGKEGQNKKASPLGRKNCGYWLQQRTGLTVHWCWTITAPKSRHCLSVHKNEMTLDYLFLAIETIFCSQGSFRCDLGI